MKASKIFLFILIAVLGLVLLGMITKKGLEDLDPDQLHDENPEDDYFDDFPGLAPAIDVRGCPNGMYRPVPGYECVPMSSFAGGCPPGFFRPQQYNRSGATGACVQIRT